MSQSCSPSSSTAVLGAVVVGLVAATLVNAAYVVIRNFIHLYVGLESLWALRGFGFLGALLVGATAGGVLLFTRPNGPLGPVLAAVSALVAGFVGDIIGLLFFTLVRRRELDVRPIEHYLESYVHLTPFGLTLLVLAPAIAAGVGFAWMAKAGGRQGPQPVPGPWGAPQPQPPFGQPARPGQYGRPAPGRPPQPGGQVAPPYGQGVFGGSRPQPGAPPDPSGDDGQGKTQGEAPSSGGEQPPQGPSTG